MSKLVALFQFLLALAGFSSGGTTWTSQVHDNGRVLSSRAHAQDGVARFECVDSSSGRCHYTLYRSGCTGNACAEAPLRSFDVARGGSRQFAGLPDFRLCVDTDGATPGPDCKPRAAVSHH